MPQNRKKRKSPASVKVSLSDLNKAKMEATNKAVEICWCIMFRVLIDKYGFTQEELKKLWNDIENYGEAVATGKISVSEIADTLKQEDGLRLI